MTRLKYLWLIAGVVISLSSCKAGNKVEAPAQTLSVQSPTEYVNPYPVQDTTPAPENTTVQPSSPAAYPDPGSSSDSPLVLMYPENFVSNLEVNSPASGQGAITGILLGSGGGDNPYITAIYLAPVESSGDTGKPPKINFSRKSNQMAVQDIENGRFIFKDVNPGQYAIVIWNPGKSLMLNDASGNPVIIEGKADEVTDLGAIYID